MKISFDPLKRAQTLTERALDFADAAEVFAGRVLEAPDLRKDYGEIRIITIGFLHGLYGRGGLDATKRGAARFHDA